MITEKIYNLNLSDKERTFYDSDLIFLEEYLKIGSLYKLHGYADVIDNSNRRLIFLKPNDCLMYLGVNNNKSPELRDYFKDYYQFLFGSKILIIGIGHTAAIRRLLKSIEKIS